ncbi:MAG: SGNH/GDSL hydrolase family protein [Bacteroidales bacterium]|nr:SGNH/GDSL hydrolase family protein [Bacteroidales bacterium]
MLSTLFLILAAALSWHDPVKELPHSPVAVHQTFDRGCIDFSTNSGDITVRYVLKSRKVPKGATRRASLGVDLYDYDVDGVGRLLDGEVSLGTSKKDTLSFSVKGMEYGNAGYGHGHEFRLYLPLYNEIAWLEIGTLEDREFIFEPYRMEKAIAFYHVPVEGVERPAMSVRNCIQRMTDFPVEVVSRAKARKGHYLMAVDGACADTVNTVREVFRTCGMADGLPEIVLPVRQRRDMKYYDWTERHAQILNRVREVAPNPDVALIGNSITHYWSGEPYNDWHSGVDSWESLFGDRNVINLGYGWDRLGNMMWRVLHEEFDGYSARHIFVMAGTNDIYRRPEEVIAEGTIKLLEYIRVKQPEARIHVVHIYPRRKAIWRVDKVNAKVDQLLKESSLDNYDIIDVKSVLTDSKGNLVEGYFTDGLHPNAEGYRRIASVYREFLKD